MLEKGKKVGEYILLEKLGAGGFGDVWKAEKRTALDTNHFALKFFRPKQDGVDFDKIGKELAVWKQLRGLPHIISVIELDRFEDYVYVVSDFADGGSLETWLSKNGKASTETEAVKIALEILTGLENLHGKNFVHRDLKPDNILIMNGRHCLADFGISREIKTHSKATGTAGTMEYMPPEAFEKSPSVTPQTDIWAVGVILQRLITGNLPYPQDEQPSLIAAILMSEPDEMPASVSQSLREIVKKSLQKNREDRFQSANEMREALKDSLVLTKQRQKFEEEKLQQQRVTWNKIQNWQRQQEKGIRNQQETEDKQNHKLFEDQEYKNQEKEKYIIAPTKDWREIEVENKQSHLAEAQKLKESEKKELENEQSKSGVNLKSLFQITGIVPLGLFFLMHLFTTSKVMNGAKIYEDAIAESQQMPFLLIIEIFGVFLPLLFHSVYGIFVSTKSQPNISTISESQWFYLFQRITGIFLFFFIAFHLLHFRFGLFGGFGLTDISVAGNAEKAFDIVASDFQILWILIFYIFGVIATSWHFAYGFFAFAIGWQFVVNRETQKLAFKVCTGLAIFLSVIGVNTTFAFLYPCGLLPRGFCEEIKKVDPTKDRRF